MSYNCYYVILKKYASSPLDFPPHEQNTNRQATGADDHKPASHEQPTRYARQKVKRPQNQAARKIIKDTKVRFPFGGGGHIRPRGVQNTALPHFFWYYYRICVIVLVFLAHTLYICNHIRT